MRSHVGFGRGKTKNPDSFVRVNIGSAPKKVQVFVPGTRVRLFEAFRTTEDNRGLYARIGEFPVEGGAIVCELPAGSVATFYGRR